MYIHVIFNPNQVKKPQGNKIVQYFKILNSVGLRRNDRNKTRLKLEQNTFKIQSNLNVDAKLLRFKFIFFFI